MDLMIDFFNRFFFGPENVQTSWIPLVIAGISALASAGSAIAGASANKRNRAKLKALEQDNERDFLREYYRGALENSGSKAYLKKLDERMKDRDISADNASTATGATHENRLASKQANNEVYSNAVAGLVEQEDLRKQRMKNNYDRNKMSLLNGEMGINSAEAQTWGQVGAGISEAASGLGAAYADNNNKKPA